MWDALPAWLSLFEKMFDRKSGPAWLAAELQSTSALDIGMQILDLQKGKEKLIRYEF